MNGSRIRKQQRKRTMTMVTWNVQGIGTKRQEVFEEMAKMKVDIGVLTETKKKGKGNEMVGEYIHFYSGVSKHERAKRGISVVVHKKYKRNIKSWEEIDERIMMLELTKNNREIVIIGVYAPTDDADIITKDQFYEKLTQVLASINKRKETLILGDLNARTGKSQKSEVVGQHGEDTKNDSGQRLIDLCTNFSLKIMNGFFPHKSIHKYTWCQPTKNLQSIIDYVIQSQQSKLKINDVRVCRGSECGSDHFMVRARVYIPYHKDPKNDQENRNEVKSSEPKYNLQSLRQESVQFLYKWRLAPILSTIENGSAEDLYGQIKGAIHRAAKESLGERDNTKRELPEWWSYELEKLIEDKKKSYQTWLNTKDTEDRKLYARLNREVKKEVAIKKNEVWEMRCAELQRYMGGTKVSEAWKTLKSLRRDDNHNTGIDLIGMKQWEEHYRQLLTEDRPEFAEQKKYDYQETFQSIQDIKKEEVERALKKMKNGKAAGPGGIPIELVKYGSDELVEKITELFNKCLINGDNIPRDWGMAYISSIHKKGCKKTCSNYRGISVTSSMGRLYGRVLKERIEQYFQDMEEQSGFRSGRSCLDNIFVLQQLVEKRIERNMTTHLMFVDLEKAYDSVPINKMFEVLNGSNLDSTYIRALENIYTNSISAIKMRGQTSKPFKISKGLRQGCCLSPTLFKIYIQKALTWWMRKCSRMGVEVGEECLYTLLFADDQVLVANDEEDITFMTRKLIEEYSQWGLKINIKKTEHLVVGGKPEDIILENGVINSCKEYKYLGSYVAQDGNSERDVQSRISQGRIAIQKLNSILWSKNITMKTKTNIYQAIVEPITTYGAECWQLTDRNKEKLKAVEMDFLRRACRVSRLDHVRNDIIRERANVTVSITDKIESRQLVWYGHIKRMNDERWPKRILEYTPMNRRRRGRPRKSWKQGIETAMSVRDMNEDDWKDRDVWRLKCGKRPRL